MFEQGCHLRIEPSLYDRVLRQCCEQNCQRQYAITHTNIDLFTAALRLLKP